MTAPVVDATLPQKGVGSGVAVCVVGGVFVSVLGVQDGVSPSLMVVAVSVGFTDTSASGVFDDIGCIAAEGERGGAIPV